MFGSPSAIDSEEIEATGRMALEYARQLVELHAARPAGSLGERRAQEWIAALAQQAGFAVEWQEFEFAPPPAYLPYYGAAALVFVLAALALPGFPWAALALPLWVFAMPQLYDSARGLLPRRRSANLLALPPGLNPAGLRLVLVAHIDTARAVPHQRGILYDLRIQAMPIFQRSAWLLAALALVQALNPPLASGARLAALLLAGGLALIFIPLELYDQLGNRQQFAPGANDNASGVGALLALMLSRGPQAQPALGYLFTGAEESGLDGARAFARRYRPQPGAPAPAALSVDMVGRGARLRIFTEVHTPRRIRTSPALNAMLRRADPAAVDHVAVQRSGDFVEFIKAGWHAAGIEAAGDPLSWRAYHTLHDCPDLLEPAAMQRAVDLIARFVDLV